MTTTAPKNHLEALGLVNGLSNETLISWYKAYQPVGSGPIGAMRTLCALIEEIARVRNLELPEPLGLPKPKKVKEKPVANPVNEKVRQVIARSLGQPLSKVTNGSTLADLGGDSLDSVEIIIGIEEEFEITLDDLEASKCKTVKDYIELAKEKVEPALQTAKAAITPKKYPLKH